MTKSLESNIEEITFENKRFQMGVASHEVRKGDLIQTSDGDFERINTKRFDGIYGTWYETPHGEFHSCMIQNYGKRIIE